MPFARTWSEELVAEWLQLKGYLIEMSLPISLGKTSGGRQEVDVVGARLEDGRFVVWHVEVGSIPGGPDSAEGLVLKKFSKQVKGEVEAYFRKKFDDTTVPVEYRMWYIATWVSEKFLQAARSLNSHVEFKRLDHFITDDVLPDIRAWKEQRGSKVAILPDSQWILLTLDHLWTRKLLNPGGISELPKNE